MRVAKEERPDVVLIYAGNYVKSETIRRLKTISWVSGFHNDNVFGDFSKKGLFRLFKQAMPSYNSHHVFRESNISQYHNAGCKNVRIMMSYYLPWLHSPERARTAGNSLSRIAHKLVFIGHAELDRRLHFIETLLNANLDLKVYGNGVLWKKYLPKRSYEKLRPIEPLYGDDYVGCIYRSKLALCFLSKGNRDTYTQRCFEIPACQGFLLCERTDTMKTLYNEGFEADFFDSPSELIEKIRFYLANDKMRKQVALAGYRRCISSGYDVVNRMRQWISDTEQFIHANGYSRPQRVIPERN
jgi:hypothetical protein